jgi:NADPH:quinone reductase-like Zn-dependent oxidoreductase
VLIDDGDVARQVRQIIKGGVDTALELVGTPTLPDTLRSVRVHGLVCFSGMLSNQWTVRDFYPLDYLPTGVRLTAYKGDAADLPPPVLQDFVDAIAAGTAAVPVAGCAPSIRSRSTSWRTTTTASRFEAGIWQVVQD